MQDKKIIKIVLESLFQKKILLFVLCICKIISVGFGIIIPYLVGEVIDNLEMINVKKIILLISLSIISLVIESVATYQFAVLGQKATIYVRNRLWSKILKLEVKYYDKTHSGELSSRIIHDTSSLAEFLTNALPDFLSSTLTLMLMIIVLFSLDKWLGTIFCLIFPILIFVMLPVAEKVRNLAITHQGIYAKLNEILTETLEHIRLVKAYNRWLSR